jgi:hypothetical protein
VHIIRDHDKNIVRDVLDKKADKDMINSLLTSSLELKYDEKYLKEISKNFT